MITQKINIISRQDIRHVAVIAAGCLMMLIPVMTFAQTTEASSDQRAVMKIEESTHKYTPENREAQQITVSKVYDSGDSLGNSYIVRVNGTDKAIIIDPGYNYEAIAKYLEQIQVTPEAILLTNGYFLRIAGNEELRKRWPNVTILIGEEDAGLLTDTKANMSAEFGGVTSPIANVWVKDGDAFEIAGIPLTVIGTPGHTAGSMTYVLPTDDNVIAFTGDFIYKDGISSASLPSSNEEGLQKSLDKFLETQFAETLIFPGYGENTSVAEFYQQMTGKSIAMIDSSNGTADDSPVIIVERDPATTVLTETVYVPTVEYRTETIVVDRYVRPWVSLGVTIPLWSHWYRPWHSYDYHYHRPLPPPVYRPPHYRPPYWGGGSPPPLIVPPRPGRPDLPPGGHWPSIRPPRPGDGPAIRPPRPDDGPNRPGQGLTPGTRPTPGIIGGNRPIPGTQPGNRPTPGTRPTPGIIGGDRPIPGTQPGNRPTPGTRPTPGIIGGDRPIPGTRPTPTVRPDRPAPSTRPTPTVRPDRPAPSTRPTPTVRPDRPAPSTRPTPTVRPDRPAPSTRPTPAVRPDRPAPSTRPTPTVRPDRPAPSTRPTPAVRPDRPAARPDRPTPAASTRPTATRPAPSARPAATARPDRTAVGPRGDRSAGNAARTGGGPRGGQRPTE